MKYLCRRDNKDLRTSTPYIHGTAVEDLRTDLHSYPPPPLFFDCIQVSSRFEALRL